MSKAAPERRTSCERKVRHATEGAAFKSRRSMGIRGKPLLAYRCSECGGWHLGNDKTDRAMIAAAKGE